MRDETPAAAAIPIEASEIPLDDVVDSPLRKRHVPGDLEELAASIRSRGVLQPILVRPRRGRWEIVCGHRRVHAARLAGLALIPVVIRDMSDDEVLAAFLVAKCQRKDIHPIDEGDGYYELRTVHGWTVSRIAQEVGKASSTVLSRLKLRDLAPGPWEAYIDGRLSGAIALFIARIPAPDLQEKATREVVGSGAEPMSARDATEHLRRNYMFTAVGPEMKPGDIFDCGPLTCRLTAAACVTRQDARTKAGNPVHSPCGGGKCAQGADVRAALGGFKAPTVPRGPLFRGGLPPPLAGERPALELVRENAPALPERAEEREAFPEPPPEPPSEAAALPEPERAQRLKKPSRQTREWLAFTEEHGLADILDDPSYWAGAVVDVVQPLPLSEGQRLAAIVAGARHVAVRAGVSRRHFLRVVALILDHTEREKTPEAA
jgi:ParB/RepB/Spo0J family partition protein